MITASPIAIRAHVAGFSRSPNWHVVSVNWQFRGTRSRLQALADGFRRVDNESAYEASGAELVA